MRPHSHSPPRPPPYLKMLLLRRRPPHPRRYLTPAGAVYRLLTAPARIGRFFDASGSPVYAPEHERILGKGAKATARRQALARARTSSLGMAYSLSLAFSFVVMVAVEGRASAFTGH